MFRIRLEMVIVAGALISLSACRSKDSEEPTAAPSTSASATASTSSPDAESKLDKIFSADAIGENVTYLESMTGPAFTALDLGGSGGRSDKLNTYKVDGCLVIAGVSDGKVDNIGIDNYSKKCSFDIGKFFGLNGNT